MVLTHSNILSAFKSVFNFLFHALGGSVNIDREVYIAFLPLAHILEFLAENVLLTVGVKIGYSSPYTLMDTGTAIKKGTKASSCNNLIDICGCLCNENSVDRVT